jgi:hypothetical protein
MTDPVRVAPARVLAALEVLGWPDDREGSCDGGFTPRGEYWELAEDVVRAADDAATKEGT